MGQLNDNEIWDEVARRKRTFHANEKPDDIHLWLLAYPGDIKRQILARDLIPLHKYPRGCPGWYYPSIEAYEKYVKPKLIKYGDNQ